MRVVLSARPPLLLLLLVHLSLAGCAAAPPAPPAPQPLVIVLSLDGMRHDMLERGNFPHLGRLATQGRRGALVPSWPSNTFPGHVAMATGVRTDQHQLVDNSFRERQADGSLRSYNYGNDASWIMAEPLWITATRQGIPAATFYWIGSESPWRGTSHRYAKAPFDLSVDDHAKVRQILAWFDLPAGQRPGLVMAWWHGADKVAHKQGPDHPAVVQQVLAQDAALGELLAGLDARNAWGQTTLLLVSDHGMAAFDRGFDAAAVLQAAGIGATVTGNPGMANVYLDAPDGPDRAAALAALSGRGATVHDSRQLPPAWRMTVPGRNGDLVVLGAPPLGVKHAAGASRILPDGQLQWLLPRPVGSHGFDPALPEMHALLLAMGRGVCTGPPLAPVANTRVASTVAALLGMAPPPGAEEPPVALCGQPGTGPGR